jgi:hypothetical protein
LNGTVYALATFGGNLVVGGNFQGSGANASPNYLASWDGSNWTELGAGIGGPVYSLLADAGILYVGGAFSSAGATQANSIAAWDGTNWSALGQGVRLADYQGARPALVYCLATFGNKLYAGGEIYLAGTNSAGANDITAWDGSDWSPCGSGLTYSGGFSGAPTTAQAMLVMNGLLYVTGELINSAGGVSVSGLAAWNGTAWESVDTGLWSYGYQYQSPGPGNGYALAASGDEILIGGLFGAADGLPASGLAVWQPSAAATVSPPLLSFSTAAGQLKLTWPAAATGFTLERSAALGSGASWSAVAGSAATNSITVGISGACSFFRLRQ